MDNIKEINFLKLKISKIEKLLNNKILFKKKAEFG